MSFTPTSTQGLNTMGAGLTAVSTGLGAIGGLMKGSSEKAALDAQANEVETAGIITKEQLTQEEEALRSQQASAYARAGVKQSGSVLDVMLDSATDYEFDKLTADYNTKIKAMNLRYAGQQAMSNAYFGVGTSLFSGALKMGDYMRVPTHNTTTYQLPVAEGVEG